MATETLTAAEEGVLYEQDLIRRRDSGEITQMEYMDLLNEHRADKSLEEIQAQNLANATFGTEGALPELHAPGQAKLDKNKATQNREIGFASAAFNAQGGFFDILGRTNALNNFGSDRSMFDAVAGIGRAAAARLTR